MDGLRQRPDDVPMKALQSAFPAYRTQSWGGGAEALAKAAEMTTSWLLGRIFRCGSGTSAHGNSVSAHGSSISAHGSGISAHGNLVSAHGSGTSAHGNWVSAHGSGISAHGNWVSAHGSGISAHGNAASAHGPAPSGHGFSPGGARFVGWLRVARLSLPSRQGTASRISKT
jgi:hypothetical protein